MYACIPEIGSGFFEVVRTPSNATAHSCDPPLPLTLRELTLATPVAARENEVNLCLASSLFETFTVDLHTPHRRHLRRGN